MIEHIALGFFIGTTLYLWFVNYGLVRERDLLADASIKLMAAIKKQNEETKTGGDNN